MDEKDEGAQAKTVDAGPYAIGLDLPKASAWRPVVPARINEEITSELVNLGPHRRQRMGVMNVVEALGYATAVGHDLMEANPNTDPPSCDIVPQLVVGLRALQAMGHGVMQQYVKCTRVREEKTARSKRRVYRFEVDGDRETVYELTITKKVPG